MSTIRKMFFISLFLFSTVVRGAELAPDPFLGTWILDVKASHYPGKMCPREMTIEMTRIARGMHYHSETVPANGEPFHVDYTAEYNGKPVVVTGDRGILLPVTLRRESPGSIIASYGNGFQVMATSHRIISEDGKVMTITTVSHDSTGMTQTNTGVYRRAETERRPAAH